MCFSLRACSPAHHEFLTQSATCLPLPAAKDEPETPRAICYIRGVSIKSRSHKHPGKTRGLWAPTAIPSIHLPETRLLPFATSMPQHDYSTDQRYSVCTPRPFLDRQQDFSSPRTNSTLDYRRKPFATVACRVRRENSKGTMARNLKTLKDGMKQFCSKETTAIPMGIVETSA